jgi:murein DD-endopeptidase / murein LD-carboxypeptidase
MKKLLVLLVIFAAFSSCKSSKKITKSTTVINRTHKNVNTIDPKTEPNITAETEISSEPIRTTTSNLATDIINFAKQFDGVRYRYGGTTKAGMDCSGLVTTAFSAYNISLPRSSRDMAKEGIPVKVEDVMEGDLLFFKTNGRNNSISHVGLVVTSRTGLIEFIHASTSAGVIVSSLAERYWYNAFVEARRVIP